MNGHKTAENAPQAWVGELPVPSRYTYGIAGERFFHALKDEGQLLGTRCEECDRTYVPAVAFCERCLSPLDEYIDVGTTGEIYTYTLLYEDLDGTPREDPQVVAFISFGDGGIVHKVAEVALDEIQIGDQVEAVFKPAGDRKGSILDITHFRPVQK